VFAEDASVFGGDFALAAQNHRPDWKDRVRQAARA